MSNKVFGIDLGTSNIKIFDGKNNSFINEKNMIAISNKKDISAVGNKAYEMFEKTPKNMKTIFPLTNGVIADIASMQMLLRNMITKISGGSHSHADYYMAVPTDITDVERRAFLELVYSSKLKAKIVYVVEKPIADALGVGLDVTHAKGIMIVNIGSATTEISILSLGGIVLSKLIKVGGNKFDQNIQSVIKRSHNLEIGDKTAESIKTRLAFALKDEEKTATVYGREIVSGLPREMTISSGLIYDAIEENLYAIIDAIKVILERTPPELAADIIDTGIYLTGGSSNIRAIDKLIHMETGLKINTCEEPSESVIRGVGRIILEDDFSSLASTLKEKSLS